MMTIILRTVWHQSMTICPFSCWFKWIPVLFSRFHNKSLNVTNALYCPMFKRLLVIGNVVRCMVPNVWCVLSVCGFTFVIKPSGCGWSVLLYIHTMHQRLGDVYRWYVMTWNPSCWRDTDHNTPMTRLQQAIFPEPLQKRAQNVLRYNKHILTTDVSTSRTRWIVPGNA